MKKKAIGLIIVGLSLASCGRTASSIAVSSVESSNSAEVSSESATQISSVPESSGGISSSVSSESASEAVSSSSEAKEKHTVYVVGDSTLCDFPTEKTYYRRYGYGTQLYRYFSSDLTIDNLALSGRSSLSFISEDNYTSFKTDIKAGDFLIIGFGHNDEKAEAARYTDPNGDSSTQGSFKYSLYTNYIKVAEDKGAYPVLCTPVCRYSSSASYTGSNIHVTTDTIVGGVTYAGGDYAKAIVELGQEKNVPVIDLTTETKTLLTSLSADDASHLFAWSSPTSMYDSTHLSIWGAAYAAYFVAKDLPSTSALYPYVNPAISAPTRAETLTVNPNYVESSFDGNLTKSTVWTSPQDPWYGTAFGAIGNSTVTASNLTGSITQSSAASFDIAAGNPTGDSTTEGNKGGKISSTADGFVMVFQTKAIDNDYTFTAKAKVNKYASVTSNLNQSGFGLMVRSDMYIDTKQTVITDYAAAGLTYQSSGTAAFAPFARVNGELNKDTACTAIPAAGTEVSLSIVKNNTLASGASDYTCKFGDTEVKYAALDLNNTAKTGNVYFCLFCSRCISISYTDVSLVTNN